MTQNLTLKKYCTFWQNWHGIKNLLLKSHCNSQFLVPILPKSTVYVIDLEGVHFGHMYFMKVPTFDWHTRPVGQ
jgi:hypothetical protein